MPRTKTDPRARRSLELLRTALINLMATRDLDEISVAELCREAHVHRTTFYKHFSSTTELATVVFAELVENLLPEHIDEASSVADLKRGYRQGLVGLLEHVASERVKYRRLLGSHGDLVFQRIIVDRLVAQSRSTVAALEAAGAMRGVDPTMAAAMAGMSVAGALTVWAEQDGEDAEAAADQVLESLPPWWPRTVPAAGT